MPELPDLTLYVEALERRLQGAVLERARVSGPSLLRTAEPPLAAVHGRVLVGVRRLAKRLVFELEDELFLVFHLMIAGRFHWKKYGTAPARKRGLAAFDFARQDQPLATLLLTEASTQKRASLHVVSGAAGLRAHDPGGLEVLEASPAQFRERLLCENHTLKRSLTDPRLFSGIGNAYSDEILHRARLSPVRQSQKLEDAEIERLYEATRTTLREWVERLRAQTGDDFPQKVTAFRPEMAAHGRYGEPCPVCGAPIQRIVYAANETNYCAPCQTGGKLLADRALSRLLKRDWPRTLDELEQRLEAGRGGARA